MVGQVHREVLFAYFLACLPVCLSVFVFLFVIQPSCLSFVSCKREEGWYKVPQWVWSDTSGRRIKVQGQRNGSIDFIDWLVVPPCRKWTSAWDLSPLTPPDKKALTSPGLFPSCLSRCSLVEGVSRWTRGGFCCRSPHGCGWLCSSPSCCFPSPSSSQSNFQSKTLTTKVSLFSALCLASVSISTH